MNQEIKTKIGILGGLGPESTRYFYNKLIKLYQKKKEAEYPNILINSVQLWKFVKLLEKDNKKEMIKFLKSEIDKIQQNADFLAIPCNTIHVFINKIREISNIPVLGIHEEVSKKVNKSNVNKVGIIGTKFTANGNFYQKELNKYSINFETLNKRDEKELNQFIFKEMLKGGSEKEMKNRLKNNINILHKKGCDGVILACTELPIFISDKEVDVKLFSSTDILAESTIEKTFNKN